MRSLGNTALNLNAQPETFLTYHAILPESSPYSYDVSVRKFREHVRLCAEWPGLQKHGMTFPRFTFDDGHISQFLHALPALEEHSVKGIFFITTGWTGKRANYMDWPELRRLVDMGHEVHSHGYSHALLTHCSEKDLQRELLESKNALEDSLGTEVDSISMPGGRWNGYVVAACVNAGYKRIFTSDPWHKRSQRIQLLGRFNIEQDVTPADLQELLRPQSSRRAKYVMRHHAKTLIRSLVGDHAYHWLWAQLTGWREEK